MLIEQCLQSLLSPWFNGESRALKSIPVTHLELDSRKVTEGDIFVAILGHATDGRKFIPKAIENGASAIIAQACKEQVHGTVKFQGGRPVIYLDNLNHHLSELASRLYRSSCKKIGVTGTNGKTTITQLIAQWIELLGKRAAVMGTTGNGFLQSLETAENTTGSAIDIQRTLARLSDLGADFSALEISSHGLVQGRVNALSFSAGVFTNLSRDHLDYHGTMSAYAEAKKTLFTQHKCEHAIINVDDEVGSSWLAELTDAVAVSINHEPCQRIALWATEVRYSESGIELSFDGHWGSGSFTAPLIGEFNASNILLSLATLLSLGFNKQTLIECASQLQPVIGRMELFKATNKAKIVVDYAHTPDALEKALMALRVHCSGKLWAIFGCGGDRDTGKRPMMAEIAERLADKVILTDDNPRSEDADVIFKDMMAGMKKPQIALAEHDRFLALKTAVERASNNDIILLAGKGHEDYQVLNNKTIHYSDRESAMTILGIHS